ncbi:hypothetical protein ISCGN_016651 [Ixodes scapularis]
MRTTKSKLKIKKKKKKNRVHLSQPIDGVFAENGFRLRVVCFLSLVGYTFGRYSRRNLSKRAPNTPCNSTSSSASPPAADPGKFLGPMFYRKGATLCNFTRKKPTCKMHF